MKNFLQQSLYPPTKFSPQQSKLNNNTLIIHHAIGVLEVIPNKISCAMVISSGLHGNETAPIELVDGLVKAIFTGQITPRCRLLFIIAHPKAILQQKRFIDENLNRLFEKKMNTKKVKNIEQNIASNLCFYVGQFYQSLPSDILPWHLDLHCTMRKSKLDTFAIIPSSVSLNANKIIQFCRHAKLNAAILSESDSHTFSWWSGKYFNAVAATIELGQVAPLYKNNLKRFDAIIKSIKVMIKGKMLPEVSENHCFMQYKVSRTLQKNDDSFSFAIGNDVPNFTSFFKGELIATENKMRITAQEGETIIFPNANVAKGQRAGLLIKAIKD